jgi:hypothetical protein
MNDTIYLVMRHYDYEGYDVVAVVRTLEEAQAAIDGDKGRDPDAYYVKEWRVGTTDYEVRLKGGEEWRKTR